MLHTCVYSSRRLPQRTLEPAVSIRTSTDCCCRSVVVVVVVAVLSLSWPKLLSTRGATDITYMTFQRIENQLPFASLSTRIGNTT